MECNFLEKSPEEFVELFYSGLLSGCQADYDDTEAIVMKETTKTKISSQYQIFFYRLIKKTCWKIETYWYEVTTLIEAVEQSNSHQACSSNRRICTVRLSKSYYFHCFKLQE
jgi:hypothetical protein